MLTKGMAHRLSRGPPRSWKNLLAHQAPSSRDVLAGLLEELDPHRNPGGVKSHLRHGDAQRCPDPPIRPTDRDADTVQILLHLPPVESVAPLANGLKLAPEWAQGGDGPGRLAEQPPLRQKAIELFGGEVGE